MPFMPLTRWFAKLPAKNKRSEELIDTMQVLVELGTFVGNNEVKCRG